MLNTPRILRRAILASAVALAAPVMDQTNVLITAERIEPAK